MRKYNGKMKKTMLLIFGLFIVIIVVFSLFIKKSIDIERTYYEVSDGDVLFDKEYNMINIVEDGIVKIKWGGDYYLDYNEDNYNLGKNVVVYNVSTGDIDLYGKFYEVLISGEVDVIKGDNKIKSSVNSKFYKLADRKYLIIDRVIEDKDSNFSTSNYLIINLDKMGNATLLNDKTSYKTIRPTVLKTSSFTFDIANEMLYYGDKDINLKKIIGSTNEYDEDTYNLNYESSGIEKEEEEDKESAGEGGDGTGTGTGTGTGSGSGSGDGTGDGTGEGSEGTGEGTGIGGLGGTGEGNEGTSIGIPGEGGTGIGGTGEGGFGGAGGAGGPGGAGGSGGTGTGEGGDGTGNGSSEGIAGVGGNGTNADGTTTGGSSDYENNYSPGVSDETVEEIINATKNTSVIRVTANLDTIEVDYVVYDPNREYKSVYIELLDIRAQQTNRIYLTKTDTNMVIRDLKPNSPYQLTFKYTYNDELGNLKEYEFDKVDLSTKMPGIYILPMKIANNKLYYKIAFDNAYTIAGGTVQLFLNDQIVEGVVSSINASKPNVREIYSDDENSLDLSGITLDGDENILEMRIMSLSFNTYSINNPGIGYKFRY